jgi:hypothetical protein
MLNFKPKKSSIELDDFIDSSIDVGSTINPKAKLADFSHIKISAIDPSVSAEISGRVERAKRNLEKMKAALKKPL